MRLIDAVGTLRVEQYLSGKENEALDHLILLALRQERALKFYADPQNYIDGVPLHPHPEDGLLSVEDVGHLARRALGEDFQVGPITVSIEAGNA